MSETVTGGLHTTGNGDGIDGNVCCVLYTTMKMLLKVVELTGYIVSVEDGSMKTVSKRW